jgi:carboxyl-terminal processing protease
LIQRDYKNKKDKEDYYSQAGNKKEEEGDNLNHKVEGDASLKIFKTNAGRMVYGGGGITPDYIVKTEDITDYTSELLKNNIFYLFVLKYLDNHASEIKTKYHNDFNLFLKDYKITSGTLNDFTDFASSKNVKMHEEDLKKDNDYITARLKAQIARNFWKNDGWYQVLLKTDNQIEKAETLFQEAKDLAKLK